MRSSVLFCSLLFSAQLFVGVLTKKWGLSSKRSLLSASVRHFSNQNSRILGDFRGGSSSEADEERYSRQVYTLGARAHGLVRSATVYIDGPSQSGLLYECAKNLALSGIGNIVIVSSKDKNDENYHFPKLDDLGLTYIHGARVELGLEEDTATSNEEILKEFLLRLNPSLRVSIQTRDDIVDDDKGSTGILLCVDRPYDTQVRLNQLSRNCGFPFVAVETAGVYGQTFCDFGPTFEIHDVDGETPLVVPLDRIEILDESEKTILVRSVSGEKHDVSKGDEIDFKFTNGEILDASCYVVRVKSPELIEVKVSSETQSLEEITKKVNDEAASFSRLKKLERVAFVPLLEATKDALVTAELFTPSDLDKSFDETRRNAVFSSFQALNDFVNSKGRLPKKGDWNAFSAFASSVSDHKDSDKGGSWENHCRLFLNCCAAKFVPIQAIFGAVASQECLKAASGLYNPIRQFLLYDCDEVLPSSKDNDGSENGLLTSGQSYILGHTLQKVLENKKMFVVGAGAIGCEIMKNLSAMGAGTGEKGSVIVTDMDTIERSNLSRQLLFRDTDIGKFKSKAAEEAIRRLNPSMKMECHTSKVGGDDHGPFDSQFWSKEVDVVLNALDNMEARLFMDGQCVANEIALVDAGTLGSKGNVQVVVPHQSESYGSSADPPEPAIPVCTLKNFPYSISHTIQWGRDLFDGLFVRRPKQGNQYSQVISEIGIDRLVSKLDHDLGDQAALDAAKELNEDLSMTEECRDVKYLREHSIEWAARLANEYFNEAIQKLLREHPKDSLDEDGEPFWSGARKIPKPLSFSSGTEVDGQQSAVNKNLVDFVRTASRLRIETYLGSSDDSEKSIVTVEEAEAALQYSQTGPANAEPATTEATPQENIKQRLLSLASLGPDRQALNIAEFEKDDESNGHVAFITSASNLRALCYGIAPVDAMETRRVAGKIVPAMVTTTAFVSALSCLELLKLTQGLALDRHRNAFINLALPFFAFTMPLPAEEIAGLHGQAYTLWDRITIKEGKKTASSGGITLRKLLKRLKKKACEDPDAIDISTVSFGQFMIYADFLNQDDDDCLDKRLWDLVKDAVDAGNEFEKEFSRSKNSFEESSHSPSTPILDSPHLDLTVVVEDLETGEEIELPPVRVLKTIV